jgi:hypothetical protein
MSQHHAAGPFDVTLTPQGEPTVLNGATTGRMAIDKLYHGDLNGRGSGEMLSALTVTEGSAGYVAIERVTGTLHGRTGSFVVQHSGTMARGNQQLSITVVPDSGDGELAGISGTMRIRIEERNHFYELLTARAGCKPAGADAAGASVVPARAERPRRRVQCIARVARADALERAIARDALRDTASRDQVRVLA